ncbi:MULTISPECIES: 50S ribosomal protein L29 [Psychrilyobacter]|jgi:large subunit ribosomal protein L29|uniref:Large ribosomal subunit protein uL29 n=1 Tax=Psychrilyobacter piezotolerans TaxID=2293438 RepID=A0ABX9KHC7_9FUSO|nr:MULTISPECIES: 50S ribosomal protein L29 [Psychrilyobacter]UUV19356.1 50S ribosomal protein L29 [Fusobacteria bacterium ZRK30]MCS5422702.1 50S ribosomal protein L29 [Psychrilyobacter sp. S5]NDI77890.1 50S ribosomal protein L29 [Psychrilyobacter piezotolerans]RDE62008.1 50S ribosomal protein L29 [Psychrilyobacter sp. S5]REI41255.1 50S ribosomal protein L29 [Psychrilyobacter piezotolerans]
MEAKEIRGIATEELVVKAKELKEELFNLKFQLSLGQLANTAKIREVRRNIARIKTILNERTA